MTKHNAKLWPVAGVHVATVAGAHITTGSIYSGWRLKRDALAVCKAMRASIGLDA